MPIHKELGHAGLTGWREKVADAVAPHAARRGPVDEDQARALVGALFFGLSLYYVISTVVKAVQRR